MTQSVQRFARFAGRRRAMAFSTVPCETGIVLLATSGVERRAIIGRPCGRFAVIDRKT